MRDLKRAPIYVVNHRLNHSIYQYLINVRLVPYFRRHPEWYCILIITSGNICGTLISFWHF